MLRISCASSWFFYTIISRCRSTKQKTLWRILFNASTGLSNWYVVLIMTKLSLLRPPILHEKSQFSFKISVQSEFVRVHDGKH